MCFSLETRSEVQNINFWEETVFWKILSHIRFGRVLLIYHLLRDSLALVRLNLINTNCERINNA